MEIKQTTDYSLFKKLEGNRDVKKKNSLVKSIQEMDLTMYNPIIVSDKFKIVDGQHRFEACKELGKPIYFIVIPSQIAEKAMIILNRNQSQWRSEQFFNYKVYKVGDCYDDLKRYMDKYKMALSYAVILYPDKEFDTRNIKKEDFVFKKGKQAEEMAEYWSSEEFKKLPFRTTKAFVRAVRIFYENSTPRQRKKLLSKVLCVPAYQNYNQYLTAFYNLLKMRK